MKRLFLLLLLTTAFACSSKKSASTPEKPAKALTFGDTLHTQYFDVWVHGAELNDAVDTGNEFTSLAPQAGSQYLVFSVSFKNTDTESRVPLAGSVWINYNGKNYEFDKAETIMAKNWGVGFEPINPLETRSCNLVFKLSSELKGVLYWQPGRAGTEERINIGTLK